MAKLSRRGLFGLIVAAPIAAKIAVKEAASADWSVVQMPPVASTGASISEMIAVTHRAFLPKIAAQVYKESPLWSLATKGARREPV